MAGQPDSDAVDPLFPVFNARQMLVIAALVELITVVAIWRLGSISRKASAVLCLSLLFVTYRVGLKLGMFRGYCSCLGYWADWAHLSKAQVNTIALSILGFMFAGSLLVLASEFSAREARCPKPGQQPKLIKGLRPNNA